MLEAGAMRILSFSHDGTLYGAQRSLVGLLRGLQRRGHEILLAIPAPGALQDHALQQGTPARIVPYPFPSTKPLRALQFILGYPAAARRIRRLVNDVEPDIVHLNTAACLTPAAALRNSKIKRVWHVRETAIPHIKTVAGRIERWSDAVIVNSRNSAGAYPGLLEGKRTHIVYNGLDLEPPDESAGERIRREFGFSGEDFVALFAGQLRPHKDPLLFVTALAAAHSGNTKIKALIAGDGPLLGRIEAEIAVRGLTEAVRIAGFRPDLPALIAAADVVVCPSLAESFPRIGLEAMALGKPMIATYVGGIPEQVVDGETGILFPPGDSRALAQALVELAGDRRILDRLGSAAALRHRMHFTESKYAEGVEEVLTRLLDQGR
jgi:glycosyltransferase involved in cell wall biosynthesis